MNDTLGRRIQMYRTAQGLSQEALGARLGVSRQAVSKWEADGAVPDTDKLIALSKLFGISLNDLLQVEEPTQDREPEQKHCRRPRLPLLVSLLLAVALIVTGLYAGQLHRRVEELEKLITASNPASLISYYDYTLEPMGEDTVYSVRLTVNRPLEGMEVSVLLTGNGIPAKEIPAKQENESGVYSAKLSYRCAPVTISAVFREGDKVYTQPLVRLTNLSPENNSDWNAEDLLHK